MYLAWKIITIAVLQSILLAAAVALYAEKGNPFFWIVVLSAGPWVGLLIGSIRTLPPMGEDRETSAELDRTARLRDSKRPTNRPAGW